MYTASDAHVWLNQSAILQVAPFPSPMVRLRPVRRPISPTSARIFRTFFAPTSPPRRPLRLAPKIRRFRAAGPRQFPKLRSGKVAADSPPRAVHEPAMWSRRARGRLVLVGGARLMRGIAAEWVAPVARRRRGLLCWNFLNSRSRVGLWLPQCVVWWKAFFPSDVFFPTTHEHFGKTRFSSLTRIVLQLPFCSLKIYRCSKTECA